MLPQLRGSLLPFAVHRADVAEGHVTPVRIGERPDVVVDGTVPRPSSARDGGVWSSGSRRSSSEPRQGSCCKRCGGRTTRLGRVGSRTDSHSPSGKRARAQADACRAPSQPPRGEAPCGVCYRPAGHATREEVYGRGTCVGSQCVSSRRVSSGFVEGSRSDTSAHISVRVRAVLTVAGPSLIICR